MAYYLPLDSTKERSSNKPRFEYFQPTEHSISVWGNDLQHGGPPTGLLTRALENMADSSGQLISKVTIDILGAIGLGKNRISTEVIRPGKQISLIQATLEVEQNDKSYRPVARATAWRLATTDTSLLTHYSQPALSSPPELVDSTTKASLENAQHIDWTSTGFIGALEVKLVESSNGLPAAWFKSKMELVADEITSDLAKFFTILDVANGLGSKLAIDTWSFMNTETSVHLYRHPIGEWVGLTAETNYGPTGFGVSTAELFDINGPVGRISQSVLLRKIN